MALAGLTAQYAAADARPRIGKQVASKAPKAQAFVQQARLPAGYGFSLSADGNTVLIGGEPAHVFIRAGSHWEQQASLPGGEASALSDDGKTALLGKEAATRVFTRSGAIWTEQAALAGSRVFALSGDGNTALLGSGAVYVRSGATWTQQVTLASGSVMALSGDGNTALIGNAEREGFGWEMRIFTRSGATWTQQFLEAHHAPAYAAYGFVSAALSADGNTALFASTYEQYYGGGNSGALVYVHAGVGWTHQATLTGEPEGFGWSVALSADGSRALVGATDVCGGEACRGEGPPGTAWTFDRSGTAWARAKQPLQACEHSGQHEFGDAYGAEVALSRDGGTGLVSGGQQGGTWVFVPGVPPRPQRPSITRISPNTGPIAGGTSVTITGSNLCEASRVRFGNEEAQYTINSPESITAISPQFFTERKRTVDVKVRAPKGASPRSPVDIFTYG